MRARLALSFATLSLAACGPTSPPADCDGGCTPLTDSARPDGDATARYDTGNATDATDVPSSDGSHADAPPSDASDGGSADAMPRDAAVDVPALDAGADTGALDSGTSDTGTVDTGRVDAGPPDDRTGGCVSGAAGAHVLRFRWNGSGAGSTAYVDYLANDLPDTTRWHVTANSMSFGYTPVFDDIFLGAGGLDLSGTGFMDVELSTVGLASITHVSIAVFGRSFDTTAGGSFTWQTFTGTGAAPADLVSNVAPYQWYIADATTEFVPGDGGVLLRIYPGPSSNALIVNTVEVCFDAL